MSLMNVDEYKKQIIEYSNYDLDWDNLKSKTFLITGATGMIGKSLIDLLMYKNEHDGLNCKIIALGRNKDKAFLRLGNYFSNRNFQFLEVDINSPININENKIDYMLHAASSTNPYQ